MLGDHGLKDIAFAPYWQAAKAANPKTPIRAILPLEHGFETDNLAVISETDILGDRLARPKRKRRAANFLAEASSLTPGDLVVHIDHGIGRYVGLKTLEVQDAPHDCLEIHYAGDYKLYLPVENIDLLTRYGAESDGVQLDRLGGAAWQSRKARAKERLREMADGLIKIAAARATRSTEEVDPPSGVYDEFCARFPYEETDDQLNAIADVLGDLSAGRPMDRLICGDVGFGKTEVALRAAFVVAMSGQQVAIVCPTTLLARQHYKTFVERFHSWPIKVRRLSRLVPAAEAAQTREDLKKGEVEIVIGTHAVLSKQVEFADLGLVIVDEEQHFGVKHKEALKALRAEVHMLTLTATPIPRTLQMALSGIREMSIIATPPVDRLAVRTYVSEFDPVTIREALLREKYRGGQAYYVVPRIKDLPDIEKFLRDQVPEVRFIVGHGQMAPSQLEDVMSAFYDGQYDVLLSTTIVESGLDIPTANTLVVHRADMFGLSQLYQLRGRVGRAKQRAYAYLTTPPNRQLTLSAEKRLRVLQSLDSLGAGFQLASHDLDIRGGGNLLGEEQSGHIREVGVELYQQMLEDAVADLKARGGEGPAVDRGWSPQINTGAAVLIPEDYVPDLSVRLALYRRLSDAEKAEDREALAAELIDRFGPLPDEAGSLLKVVAVKGLCREANVSKIDVGPKGAVISFRNDTFADPMALVQHVQRNRPGRCAQIRNWSSAASGPTRSSGWTSPSAFWPSWRGCQATDRSGVVLSDLVGHHSALQFSLARLLEQPQTADQDFDAASDNHAQSQDQKSVGDCGEGQMPVGRVAGKERARAVTDREQAGQDQHAGHRVPALQRIGTTGSTVICTMRPRNHPAPSPAIAATSRTAIIIGVTGGGSAAMPLTTRAMNNAGMIHMVSMRTRRSLPPVRQTRKARNSKTRGTIRKVGSDMML